MLENGPSRRRCRCSWQVELSPLHNALDFIEGSPFPCKGPTGSRVFTPVPVITSCLAWCLQCGFGTVDVRRTFQVRGRTSGEVDQVRESLFSFARMIPRIIQVSSQRHRRCESFPCHCTSNNQPETLDAKEESRRMETRQMFKAMRKSDNSGGQGWCSLVPGSQ